MRNYEVCTFRNLFDQVIDAYDVVFQYLNRSSNCIEIYNKVEENK